uniref:6-cysteine protein n=1 Tax=Parastrongyloides trichosuri TaxID=131310 RepID=A0A0N5A1L0_PARTI
MFNYIKIILSTIVILIQGVNCQYDYRFTTSFVEQRNERTWSPIPNINTPSLDAMLDDNNHYDDIKSILIQNQKKFVVNYDEIIKNRVKSINDFEFKLQLLPSSKPSKLCHVMDRKELYLSTGDSILCNWNVCQIGLKLFDYREGCQERLKKSKMIVFDNSILVLIDVASKQLSFLDIPYHSDKILVHACPGKDYIVESDLIKYDNKYKNESHLKRIFLPIYPLKVDLKFFKCGTIKQKGLPDIKVGFKLIDSNRMVMDIVNNKYPKSQKNECVIGKKEQKISYGFFHGKSRYDNKYKIVKWDNEKKKQLGMKIYVYDISELSNENVDNKEHVMKPLAPVCIQDVVSKSGELLPLFSSIDDLYYKVSEDVYYQEINHKDYGKQFTGKCLTKINDNINEIYFSDAIQTSMIKHISNDKYKTVFSATFNENNIKSFGIYKCKIDKKSQMINDNILKSKSIYYIPTNKETLLLNDVIIDNNSNINPSCDKINYGNLKSFEVLKNNSIINGFKLKNMDDKYIILLKKVMSIVRFEDYHEITIMCNYEVEHIKTVFSTRQKYLLNGIPQLWRDILIISEKSFS